MNTFIEIPPTKRALSNRKLLFGHGINDAEYMTATTIDGECIVCPFYRVWASMFRRCYSKVFHKTHPTYIDCSVSKEWHLFSNFKKWMETQKWQGKDLDKDIIKPNNKIYSAENCVFVSHKINSLLSDNASSSGLPKGVCFHKASNKYVSYCSVDGYRNHLGCFDTPKEASKVYRKFKSNIVLEIAKKQTDPRIKKGLLLHAEIIGNPYCTERSI